MIDAFAFVILSLLYIVTPLIFSIYSTELFEFPKMLTLYAGAALLLPLCIYKLYSIRQKVLAFLSRPMLNANYYLLTTFILFLLSQTFSTIFSIDRSTSFFGYYSRFNGGLLSLITYTILFLSTLLFVSKDKVHLLVKIIVGGGVLVALWGLPSHFGNDLICKIARGTFDTSCWTKDFIPTERMFSTLGQPNWFATYLLVLIFIVFYTYTTGFSLLNKNYERIERFIQPLLFLLFSIEIVWTKSRSGIYTGIVFIGLYFVTFAFLKLKSSRSLAPLVVCWLLFVGMAFSPELSKYVSIDVGAQAPQFGGPGITVAPGNLAQPPGGIPAPGIPGGGPTPRPPGQPPSQTANSQQPIASSATDSTIIRKLVWEGAVKLGLKYPLFGTGVETFAYAYNFTRPTGHNLTSEWDYVYNKAHNELLNYFANTGFFGLLSYLLLFGAFLIPALMVFLKYKSEYRSTNIETSTKSQKSKLNKTEPVSNLDIVSDFGFRVSDLKLFALPYFFLMLSIFTTNFFGFSTTVTNLFFYTLPALLLVVTANSQHPTNNDTNVIASPKDVAIYRFPVLYAICYLLTTIISLSYLYNYFSADAAFGKSKEYRANEEVLNAYQETQNALNIRYESVFADQQAYMAANLAANLKLQKQTTHAQELERRAKLFSEQTILDSPSNMYYYRTRAKTFYVLSISHLEDREKSKEYYEEAVIALSKAIELAPTEPKNIYTLASLIQENEPKRAKILLKKALKLKPDYVPAQELQKKLKK